MFGLENLACCLGCNWIMLGLKAQGSRLKAQGEVLSYNYTRHKKTLLREQGFHPIEPEKTVPFWTGT